MKAVKMHEAKTHFSKLIGLVQQGEEIVVQRGDTPVAKIVPFTPSRRRVFGVLKDQIEIKPGFDEIPDEFSEYIR